MAKDKKWMIFNDRFYRLGLPLTLGSESGFTGFLGLKRTSSL
jgi:hypothetical protein